MCRIYRNVTASYGIEGFTADHLAAFRQNNIERVLIAYDRDEAGNRAAEKLAKQLIDSGIDCYRIQFPKGMDANEYAQQVQHRGSKSLGVAIRSATWLGKGKAKPVTTANNAIETTPVSVAASSYQETEAISVTEPTSESISSLAAEEAETEQSLSATPSSRSPQTRHRCRDQNPWVMLKN